MRYIHRHNHGTEPRHDSNDVILLDDAVVLALHLNLRDPDSKLAVHNRVSRLECDCVAASNSYNITCDSTGQGCANKPTRSSSPGLNVTYRSL